MATPFDSKDAATAAAAYRVLLNIVPAQEAVLKAHARTGDGRFGPFRNTPGTQPGEWRPVLPAFVNDPNAWVKDVKPFMVESASQFRPSGPHSLTSPQYTREFKDVKSLGQDTSTTRSSDQTAASRYWATVGDPPFQRRGGRRGTRRAPPTHHGDAVA